MSLHRLCRQVSKTWYGVRSQSLSLKKVGICLALDFLLKVEMIIIRDELKMLKQGLKGLNQWRTKSTGHIFKNACESDIFQILYLMPKKYNRTRNTVTVSADGEFMKSALSGFARESAFLADHLSTSEKTFLNLKLLQKCQEKIFKIKQGQYQQAMQNQQKTNEILASIKAETIKQAQIQSIKGSARFMELNRQVRKRNSDCLISSWTAFVNLDITFKTKEAELLKQNKTFHNKIAQMEEKLKALYPSKTTGQKKESELQQQKKQSAKALWLQNIDKIQARINEHKLLIERLKQKIEKTQSEKLQLKNLFESLIEKCQQKFGHEVVERLERMFEKD